MKIITVDSAKCDGDRACERACSFAKSRVSSPADSRIQIHSFPGKASFVPAVCLQCREAYCVEVCPAGALSRDTESGLVSHREKKCIVCQQCTVACPFGVIRVAGIREIIKCDACGGDPACVRACRTGALKYLELDRFTVSKQRETGERYLKIGT